MTQIDTSSLPRVETARHAFVHELVRSQARSPEDRVAIENGTRRVTYGELERYAHHVAAQLHRHQVGAGSPVAIVTSDRVEMIAAMLGILQAGCAFVPLTPDIPVNRLSAMFAAAEPGAVFVGTGAAAVVGAAAPSGVPAMQLDLCQEWDEPAGAHADPDAFCYIFFTSGSTGTPKPIAGRLKAIDHFVRWETATFLIGPGVRTGQLIHPTFDAFLRDVFVPLSVGGTLVVPPDEETALDGERLLAWLEHQRIELIHCVPTTFRLLLPNIDGPHRLPHLANVLLSGETVLPADVNRWFALFGDRIRLTNLYGPSETTMTKFVHVIRSEDGRRRVVPIGLPMPGASALLLDDRMKQCARGRVGEIYIRTPYRTLGYYRRPDLTAAVFVANPFSDDPDDLLYKTGDLARVLEDGTYRLIGRRDDQVKIRGVRIEISEIESLIRSTGLVDDVAVVDREESEGAKSLCAFVLSRTDAVVERVRSALTTQLTGVMIPSRWVVVSALPRTPSGKVDRQALRAMPIGEQTEAETAAVSATEEIVLGTFRDLLHDERIGRDHHFFQSGGHSLLAMQVVGRLRKAFRVEFPLRVLFQAPTARLLAREIDEALLHGECEAAVGPRAAARGGRVPLSYAQQRLWFLEQVEPGRATYHVPVALALTGPLAAEALAQALRAVVARHEALRTQVQVEADGTAVQEIVAAGPVPLPVVDVTRLGAAARGATHAVLTAGAQAPLAGPGTPLWRAVLVREAADRHVLGLTLHHLVSDGWSLGVLLRELGTAYAAARQGQTPAWAPLPLQYADYATWQRTWLQGPELTRQLAYWRTQLAAAAALELPTDRPRPGAPTRRGATIPVRIPAALTARVRTLARQTQSTVFMVLLAGWQLVLGRWAGQADVTVGTVVANRRWTELEGLIGLFVNTLVLRTALDAAPRVRDLLAQVRDVCLGAYAHQDLPFERLVEDLNPPRDLSRHPLFQILFAMDTRTADQDVHLADVSGTLLGVGDTVAKFDLTVALHEHEGEVRGAVGYAIDLYERRTVERLLASWLQILTEMVADPSRRVSSIDLLSCDERQRILGAWNATDRETAGALLPELLSDQCRLTPDRTALIADDSVVTYAALEARSTRLAAVLTAQGVGPEAIVGIALERSMDLVVSILGVLKAGGTYMPLDPTHPPAHLAGLLATARPVVVLTSATARPALPGETRTLLLDDVEVRRTLARPLGGETTDSSAPALHPDNAAYVIHTSGSTGTPKAVVVTHRALANHMAWMRRAMPLGEHDRVLQKTTFTFDASVWEFFAPLLSGAGLVIAPREAARDPELLVTTLARHRVSVLQVVPSLLRELLHVPAFTRLPHLTRLCCGGEALRGDLIRGFTAGSSATVHNFYGPSEACIEVTAWQGASGPIGDAPIGRPIDNARAYVLDQGLMPVAVGVTGELYVSGAALARGYYRRSGITAERFVADPFGPAGTRMYRTGDLARWRDDGQLEFLGRNDDQVKVRGHRVELGAIQSALRTHPAVDDAIVAIREGGDAQLVAYVVGRAGSLPDTAALREHLQALLPDYLRPATYVWLERFPRTTSGKVDRNALARIARANPAPSRVQAALEPRDRLETEIVRIWSGCLGAAVGITDNFFELGGTSLTTIQCARVMSDLLGTHVPIRALFEHPTVRELAAVIRGAVPSRSGSPLLPLHPVRGDDDRREVVFYVHPLGGFATLYAELARHLAGRYAVYGVQSPAVEIEPSGYEWRFESLERQAAVYVAAIREAFPHGPYHLGGFSSGGAIAFEMAQQLRTSGEDVASLALIDVPPLNLREMRDLHAAAGEDVAPVDGAELVANAFWARRFGRPLEVPAGSEEERLAYVLREGELIFPPRADLAWIRRVIDMMWRQDAALQCYRASVYPGPTILFRPSVQLGRHDPRYPELDLQSLTSLPLETRTAPGDHGTMIAGDGAAAIASWYLERAAAPPARVA